MTTLDPVFRFHLRAAQRDLSGYYYVRWDRAQNVTVLAKTQQEAINKADTMLGECPNGRGWGWTFKTDLIAEVRPCVNAIDRSVTLDPRALEEAARVIHRGKEQP